MRGEPVDGRSLRLARIQQAPGFGPAALSRLLSECGVPEEGFFGREPAWYRGRGVSRRAAEWFAKPGALDAGLEALPVQALLPSDAQYPSRLRSWGRPPPLLWTLEGRSEGLTNGNMCVIASASGVEFDREAAKSAFGAAAEAGWTIVAGHNRPVYVLGLLVAKRMGTSAWMPLDRGLLEAFDGDLSRDPVAPARIWGYAFEPHRCAPLSPFRLGDPWIGANARARDELVVGLSDVVVTAGVRPGGTIHGLCLAALRRGRVVMASPRDVPLLGDAGARTWEGRLAP